MGSIKTRGVTSKTRGLTLIFLLRVIFRLCLVTLVSYLMLVIISKDFRAVNLARESLSVLSH